MSRVQSPSPTVLAIVGPTGVGKSTLGLALARRANGEIVNADSMQLYRGMNIGTAKASDAERAEIPHHLLDILDIAESSTVSAFQALARSAIVEIQIRGRVPILVGGSGLYVRAVLDDLEFPGTDPVVRARLESELDQFGPQVLHERLQSLDPGAAAAIHPANGRRIVRALEVIELTGQPFTATLPGATPVIESVRIGLAISRVDLLNRVSERVDQMWRQGFIAEVEGLAAGGFAQSRTAIRALGYKQALDQLAGDLTQEQAKADTIQATMQFARRQMTWFRRDPLIHWLPYDIPDLADQVLALRPTPRLGS
ncbi:MAG: tRNA (adenosine(37)-N6)-dimethylallyltransferase MiaA [Actinomycetes bacterium]